jgi:alpha-glucosidase
VLEPGARTRAVYLPKGSAWYNWHNGSYYSGGDCVTLDAPLERTPLLAREGGIIPTEDNGVVRLYAFPHRREGAGTFDLFQDDGESMDYLRGQYQVFTLKIQATPDGLALSAGGLPGAVEWILPPGERRAVSGAVDERTDETGRRVVRLAAG